MNQIKIPKKNSWLLVGILISSFIVFLPTIESFFVLDDFFWVEFYKAFSVKELMRHYTFFFRIQCDGFYRPMLSYIYGVDFLVWKLNPVGYHITNIAFHLANIVLVEYLIRYLTKDRELSLCSALLFALHPLHVGAVVYISGRTEVIYSFFLLLSTIFFIKNLKEKKYRFFSLSIFFFTCALFSKETTIAFLVIFAATQYLLEKKIKPRQLFPYFLVSAYYFFIRQYLIRVPLNKYGFELSRENFIRLIYNYILVMIPVNVKSFHASGLVSFFRDNLWALSVLFLVFAFLFYWSFSSLVRNKRLDISLLVYWLIWLVVSFFPIFFMSGDRLSYSPSIASSCITSAFFLGLFRHKKYKYKVLVYLPIALLGILFFSWTLDRSVIYNHGGKQAQNLLKSIKEAVPVLPENSVVFLFNCPNKWIHDDTGGWIKAYYGCLYRALEIAYRRKQVKVVRPDRILNEQELLNYLLAFKKSIRYHRYENIVVLEYSQSRTINRTTFFRKKINF